MIILVSSLAGLDRRAIKLDNERDNEMERRNTIEGFTPYLAQVEAEIINRVITGALADGGRVSVHDGEEWALINSKSRKDIQDNVAQSDETTFRCFNKNGDRVGWVGFIHGNLESVLVDYSDNESTNAIVKAANEYAQMVG